MLTIEFRAVVCLERLGLGIGILSCLLIVVVVGLFLSANFGVKMVMVTKSKVVRASEVELAGSQDTPFTETALLTLAEIAACSDKVEGEVS